MFGEQISRYPLISSPWPARLSSSVSTSASTTAPTTPPLSRHTHSANNDKMYPDDLPPLHLLDLSGQDSMSDSSQEADGFFSLDLDVSIDHQLSDVPFQPDQTHPLVSRCSPSPVSQTPYPSALSPHLRNRASEPAYSSSPLLVLGRDSSTSSSFRQSPASLNGSPSFGPIPPEVDQKGNLEYKLKILPPSRERFDRLVTQLKWRLLEGGGHAVYEIGVLDDGTLIGLDPDSMKDSLKSLSLMAAEVGATCQVQRVLALEKDDPSFTTVKQRDADAIVYPTTPTYLTTQNITPQPDPSLRSLDEYQALQMLTPFIQLADMEKTLQIDISHTATAGLYSFNLVTPFDVATHIPTAPQSTNDDDFSSSPSPEPLPPSATTMVRADSTTDSDTISAQTRHRVDKSSLNAGVRSKRDILAGLDQANVVYLPSKEEKRIQRAAAEAKAAVAQAESLPEQPAFVQSDNSGVSVMDKMTRVADSIQPKTARARARARKSQGSGLAKRAAVESQTSPVSSPASSPASSPYTKPANLISSTGPYSGYENLMAEFGVLSERAARCLYASSATDAIPHSTWKGRLIVEAVVLRDVNSSDNFIDYQGAKQSLRMQP